MASEAVASGLLSRGCRVVDLGVTSTPAVFREVAVEGLDGGISISASHNPPEWNGAKFVVKGGRGLFEEELSRFIDILNLPSSEPPAGEGFYLEKEPRYPSDIVSYIGYGSCSGVKVAVDPGGGAGCLLIPKILGELGCRVLTVNATPAVFSRGLDPTRDQLVELSQTVVSSGSDMGVAYDCDADRVVFIDEEGSRLPADYTLLIYLKHLADSGRLKGVVVSVDTSIAVEDIVVAAGGRVVYSKVGEANVIRAMLETGFTLGGEGSSGGLIVSDFNLCRDGVLATGLIANIVKSHGGLRGVVNSIPRYFSLREKIPCRREDASKVVKILAEEGGDIDLTDGVKIKNSDRSWILVRPSGTEDIIRISVEAHSEERALQLLKLYSRKTSDILQA